MTVEDEAATSPSLKMDLLAIAMQASVIEENASLLLPGPAPGAPTAADRILISGAGRYGGSYPSVSSSSSISRRTFLFTLNTSVSGNSSRKVIDLGTAYLATFSLR